MRRLRAETVVDENGRGVREMSTVRASRAIDPNKPGVTS